MSSRNNRFTGYRQKQYVNVEQVHSFPYANLKVIPVVATNAALLRSRRHLSEKAPVYGLRPLRQVDDIYGNVVARTHELPVAKVTNNTLLQSKRNAFESPPDRRLLGKRTIDAINSGMMPEYMGSNRTPQKREIMLLAAMNNNSAKLIAIELIKATIAGKNFDNIKTFPGVGGDKIAKAKEAYDQALFEFTAMLNQNDINGETQKQIIKRFEERLTNIFERDMSVLRPPRDVVLAMNELANMSSILEGIFNRDNRNPFTGRATHDEMKNASGANLSEPSPPDLQRDDASESGSGPHSSSTESVRTSRASSRASSTLGEFEESKYEVPKQPVKNYFEAILNNYDENKIEIKMDDVYEIVDLLDQEKELIPTNKYEHIINRIHELFPSDIPVPLARRPSLTPEEILRQQRERSASISSTGSYKEYAQSQGLEFPFEPPSNILFAGAEPPTIEDILKPKIIGEPELINQLYQGYQTPYGAPPLRVAELLTSPEIVEKLHTATSFISPETVEKLKQHKYIDPIQLKYPSVNDKKDLNVLEVIESTKNTIPKLTFTNLYNNYRELRQVLIPEGPLPGNELKKYIALMVHQTKFENLSTPEKKNGLILLINDLLDNKINQIVEKSKLQLPSQFVDFTRTLQEHPPENPLPQESLASATQTGIGRHHHKTIHKQKGTGRYRLAAR